MHSLTLRELKRMQASMALGIERIEAEKQTLLPKHRTGSYDFIAESKTTTIGFEVMTRPTKGKLKEKLSYTKNVDRYIFVLPAQCLGIYRKQPKRGLLPKARKKVFPAEFSNPNIRVWLLDAAGEKFTQKGAFCQIFNVEKK